MTIAPLNSIPRAVPVERRNARRIPVSLTVEVELDDAKRVAQLTELSRSGARIAAHGAKAGSRVIIRRAGIEVSGLVVWANGLMAGIRFPEPIAEEEFLRLRRRTVD